MKLEICATSLESCINAEKSGADQIELCSELSIGGVTPSYGLLKSVLEAVSIPVNVLIRPRGGDFCYNISELCTMLGDIEMAKNLGAKGIVSGVLTKNNELDVENTRKLIDHAQPLNFTFHRAFDLVENSEKILEQLNDLGVDTLLTSGRKKSALDGLAFLTKLKNNLNNKMIIMPGSGINSSNIRVFKDAGFQICHGSASKLYHNAAINTNEIELFGNYRRIISDSIEIKRMVALIG